MVRKTALIAVVLALTMVGSAVTIAAVAQDQQQAGNQGEDAVDAQSQSHLRLVHAAADAPAVDVSIDNETVASDVQFGDVSDYLDVSSGELNVTVTPAGNESDEAGAAEPVIEETVTVDSPAQTLVVHEEADQIGETGLQATVFTDDARTPGEDDAALRAIHLLPDGENVSVSVSSADAAADGPDDTETGADDAGEGEENATDAGEDGENATDAGENGDNATDAGEAGENATDAGEAGTSDGADAGAGNETDAEGQETVVASNLGVNSASDYVTVPAGDEATITVEDANVANDTVLLTSDTSLEGQSASTVWILPSGADDAGDGVQAVVTPDATLTVELPENVSDQGPADDAGENETETPEGENETETPEDEGETETPEEADETETPEDDGATETPEEADETETPADEGEGDGTEGAE